MTSLIFKIFFEIWQTTRSVPRNVIIADLYACVCDDGRGLLVEVIDGAVEWKGNGRTNNKGKRTEKNDGRYEDKKRRRTSQQNHKL